MTAWTVVEESPDYTVSISAEGRAMLADEKERDRQARLRAEVRIWAVAASIVAIACLMAKHLLGG